MMFHRYPLCASLLSYAIISACSINESEISEEEDINYESTEQATYSGWTPSTSEEYPPISCDGASLMKAVHCAGAFCDNISMYCQPVSGISPGGSYWTSFFSEEGSPSRNCIEGHWITSIACQGAFCDNIALQCTRMINTTPRNCYWTGFMSEEGGGFLGFGTGYFARGAECRGAYCDDKRFFVCQH